MKQEKQSMEARAQNATPVLTTIGVDIGRDVFHIVGFGADGKIALRHKIKRLALSDTCRARIRDDKKFEAVALCRVAYFNRTRESTSNA
jgi:hypothetical protein